MAHHHDCECGHDHHHEHEHESNSVQIDRYHEAFNKFEPALPDTQTTEAVNALLHGSSILSIKIVSQAK